jgi:hypothetical protein
MGQRHQVYLITNQGCWENGKRSGKKHVYGIHHQWLYGRTAITLLGNFFEFIDNAKKDNRDNWDWRNGLHTYGDRAWPQLLQAIYSTDIANGYFHFVHDLNKENDPCLDNPYLGDNNDGITVIDIRGDKVKYCFHSLCGLEDKKRTKAGKVLSAREYVHGYYPEKDQDEEMKNEITKLLSRIEGKAELITAKELKGIFPKMTNKEK